MLPGGGYAAYAVAAAPLCLSVPGGISMVEAAAIPETFFTVWTNLFDRGRCQAGDTVLIHGGTSGIGNQPAIQLASVWGARVFATAGSDDKARACERFGAVRGINYRTEDFVEVMRAETGGKGVDVILDMVSGSYVARNLEIASLEGRIVVISPARRIAGGNQHGHDSHQAADAHRLDLENAHRRAKGRPWQMRSGRMSGPACGGSGAAHHPRHLSAGGSREAHRLMETRVTSEKSCSRCDRNRLAGPFQANLLGDIVLQQ